MKGATPKSKSLLQRRDTNRRDDNDVVKWLSEKVKKRKIKLKGDAFQS